MTTKTTKKADKRSSATRGTAYEFGKGANKVKKRGGGDNSGKSASKGKRGGGDNSGKGPIKRNR